MITRLLIAAMLLLAATARSARADDVKLDMEGTTATVPKGNTVQRKLFGIRAGIPGTITLKLKFHAVFIAPRYAPLRVELRHGDAVVLSARTCYSMHAPGDRVPKCEYVIPVSQTEADRAGAWTLYVTNNSDFEIVGVNIEKGTDELNPLVPSFQTIYTPKCPSTVNVDMEGTTLTLAKGNTQERRLFSIGSANGDLSLRMKWHAVNLIPNTFRALKVEVMNGADVVRSAVCYSYHASTSPRCDFSFESGARPGTAWKLRITNNSLDDVVGFDVRKGADLNPLVPQFVSTYKARCQ